MKTATKKTAPKKAAASARKSAKPKPGSREAVLAALAYAEKYPAY